jgi:hypothetical protein
MGSHQEPGGSLAHRQSTSGPLATVIGLVCGLRGESEAQCAALVAEALAQSPANRADLLAHFMSQLALWRAVRGIEATTTPSPPPQSRLAGPIPARRGPALAFGALAAAHASGLTKFSHPGHQATHRKE